MICVPREVARFQLEGIIRDQTSPTLPDTTATCLQSIYVTYFLLHKSRACWGGNTSNWKAATPLLSIMFCGSSHGTMFSLMGGMENALAGASRRRFYGQTDSARSQERLPFAFPFFPPRKPMRCRRRRGTL